MNICLLSKMFPPVVGGSGMYAYEIANALGNRGHDVDVYTQSKSDTDSELPIHDNVSVYTLTNARRYLVTFETLYYSIRARFAVDFAEYDVIHGTLMPASTIALADQPDIDTPIVLTSHSFSLSEVFAHTPEKPADYLLKYLFHPMNVVMDSVASRVADRIIAISSEMKTQLSTRYGIDESVLTHVPHGVDTDRYRPRSQRHHAVSRDPLTLLFVGRLISRKGVDLAVEAVAAADRDDIELLIAGNGRLEDEIRDLARARGIDDQIQLLGYVPDDQLPVLYSSADVTLFTSNYEGFGLVFLESLAAGTPVVGAPVGGFPDLVTDGQEGLIVDRTPQALAGAIEGLADAPERATEMGQRGRELAATRTWETVATETETVYRTALDRHDTSARQ